MRTIYSSLISTERFAVAGGWLADGAPRPALILAPSRRAGQQLVRETVRERGALFGAHVLTVAQVAGELAGEWTPDESAGGESGGDAEEAPAPLTTLGVEAMTARALARCRAEAPLEFFERVAGAPGMVRALSRTLGELRHHGVPAAGLRSLGARGADLARLLGAYEDELARARVIDVPRLLADAAAYLGGDAGGAADPADLADLADFVDFVDPNDSGVAPRRRRHDDRYAGMRLLLLDLALRSPLEAALVGRLAARAPDVLAVAPAADSAALAVLTAVLGVSPEGSGAGRATGARRLRRARAWVFRADAPGSAPASTNAVSSMEPVVGDAGDAAASEGDESFVLVASPGEGAECVEIARRLLALAGEGIGFDRCGVLLRDAERYQPLVEHAFSRAGIPALFTRGVARPHAAGRALLALLDCALERFPASRFAEYLSFGEAPRVDGAGAPPRRPVPWVEPDAEDGARDVDGGETGAAGDGETETFAGDDGGGPIAGAAPRTPAGWERLLLDAAVIGGLDRWRRRLAGLRAELTAHAAACAVEEPARADRLRDDLGRLEDLERFALPLLDDLAALPAAAAWGEWLRALEGLACRALRRPRRVLEILAELRPMAAVGPVTLAEVRRALADRLTSLRSSPEGASPGRVFVGSLEEARGRSFHAVFLPGLAEGIFPRKALEDPLLLDADRDRLAAAGAGSRLPGQKERVEEERLSLSLALGAAAARMVASYPTLDGREGRQRVPSFYALDLVRAAEGVLPDQRQLTRQAAAASSFRLGWPAPQRPESAIDSDELGLAVLAQLLAGPESETRGRARFLLSLDPCLARSVRARWQRWSRKFTGADGLVLPSPAGMEALAARAPVRRAVSATALQQLAACPYRFFLQAVLGLRPREEAAALQELDPRTRGEIFHSVQAALLTALQRDGRLPLVATAVEAVADALVRLDATLDAVAAEYRERLAPALPRVWESEVEELRIDLRGWVREFLVGPAAAPAGAGPWARQPWVPTHFELGFGMQGDGSFGEPVEILGGRLRLRGRIDLVETAAAGDSALCRVTDWKTGRVPAPPSGAGRVAGGGVAGVAVGGGESLQPVLYALAAGALLGRPVASGRLAYCTRRGGHLTVEVPLGDDTLRSLGEVVDLVERSLDAGFLPAAPRQDACGQCACRAVCGPLEELRVARKQPLDLSRRLAAVRALR